MILEVFSDPSDSKHWIVKLGSVAVLSGGRSQKCCQCEGPLQAGAAGCRTRGMQGMQPWGWWGVWAEHLHGSQRCAAHSQALALRWHFCRGMWVWRLLKPQKLQGSWSGSCTSAFSLPSLKKTAKICRFWVSWGDFFHFIPSFSCSFSCSSIIHLFINSTNPPFLTDYGL